MQKEKGFMSSALLRAVLLAALLASFACKQGQQDSERNVEREDAREISVVSYGGGAYQKSHIDAFIQPFMNESKVRVESIVWGAEYGRLSEMVKSKRVPWDVVEVTAAQFARGKRENLFSKLTHSVEKAIFVPVDGSPAAEEFGVPNVYWSTVLAFRKNDFKDKQPEDWADFWDVKSFPGPRALYDDPRGNLEFALLADGVPMKSLYPLDVDRAFRKLDEIKPHVRVWWSDGTEPVSLLLNNQVAMSSAWSGRIFASEQARKTIEYRWNGAVHELDYWVVPQGSKHVDTASRFIVFASSPKPMAHQANLTAYGPANRLALEKVDPAVLPHLPTTPANWSKSFVVDSTWWSQNEAAVSARWINWKNK